MRDDFEAEVKTIKTNRKTSAAKLAKPPKRPKPDPAGKQAPLKTVGGTPIVQRTPEG